MKFNPSRKAKWIAEQSALDNAIEVLAGETLLGVDTESNSLYAYKEHVCLIQFSTARDDFLIDALADLNLEKLAPIFRSGRIEKIFHAAEYDIMCLKRDYGFSFKNIFDTMQTARILGFKQLGLSSLLEGQFRVEPVKSFQKANWGKRPLPEEMKHYARVDTHFLIPLRARLREQLKKNKVLELAKEDFRRVCAAENNHQEIPLYAHVSGYHKLDPQKLAVLNALCVYRDKLAADANRPHFKIIGSRTLRALAVAHPVSQEALADVGELSPRLAKRYGKGLVKAINSGLSAPPITIKKNKRPSQSFINRIDDLKQWRKKKGKKIGVQSDVVLPRDVLERIAGDKPKDLKSLQAAMEDVPWRFDHFGGEILDVITKGRQS